MPFRLKNVPSEFQKRMEDVFKDLDYVIVYIDDLLVFSLDMNKHKQHLERVNDKVYKHGVSLSKSKLEFSKTGIEYLGLILSQGKFELQEHVLKALS
jgi:hypothetical protein